LLLIEYATRLRIGDAFALLAGDDRPIAHIAELAGYRSLANSGTFGLGTIPILSRSAHGRKTGEIRWL